eukprot:snap_masked-scaffold_5-processed-gene-4.14-mRNA-1 protein AED:1.00 eAED:1.00 QI:0/0/0/0/1/1/2/0/217
MKSRGVSNSGVKKSEPLVFQCSASWLSPSALPQKRKFPCFETKDFIYSLKTMYRTAKIIIRNFSNNKSPWQRLSQRIKFPDTVPNSSTEQKRNTSEKYMGQVEDKTSGPASALKLLEDELVEEVAASLGRSGDKLKLSFQEMHEAHNEVLEFLNSNDLNCPVIKRELNVLIGKYSTKRSQAEVARWELIIHRQSIGFRYKNVEIIEKTYPLLPILKN